MKKIYTSNYARQSGNPKAIGISLVIPEWYEGATQPSLAPTSDMVFSLKRDKKGYNKRKYIRDYIDMLNNQNIDPFELIQNWDNDTMLLCYESPNEFCHRHVLADWIKDRTGVEIQEWMTDSEREEAKQNEVVDSIVIF